ncbi:related to cAMP receptor (Car4) [Cephalotrichum gorgonifer]|uniref:Related to cAMP receptor (Car4) n=1 Tax=Cephalotrichum gorgonifer TaxID=2041049 RepID=A0AAE8SUT2_9PEZI|nr:related to cAMP receptor (Car4) [Cephalotrichum gorgonifer]
MRTTSTLSALGVITIIVAFCTSRHFRNPMHRLIFINAFFNAFDVICTMISVNGPLAGNRSALCQFQGFLNQMFPVADVLWTLAMAINVYLIVFRRYDGQALKRLERKYIAVITTFTFIPALVFLFIDTDDKGPMYGSVTLWCAIAPKWVLIRIVCYYVTIWTAIIVTIVLYILVGIEIAKRRRDLKATSSQDIPLDNTVMLADDTASHDKGNPDAIGVAVTTEVGVRVHHSRAGSTSHSLTNSTSSLQPTSVCSVTTARHLAPSHQPAALSFRQYILMPLFFFLALLSVWVAPSTNRLATFVDPTFSSFPLLLTVGTTGCLRGFWNGLVFITMGMKSWKRQKDLKKGKRREREAQS